MNIQIRTIFKQLLEIIPKYQYQVRDDYYNFILSSSEKYDPEGVAEYGILILDCLELLGAGFIVGNLKQIEDVYLLEKPELIDIRAYANILKNNGSDRYESIDLDENYIPF